MNNFTQMSFSSSGIFSRLFLFVIGFGVVSTCLAEGHADLQITNIVQSPGNPVTPGDTVSYTLTIQNSSTGTIAALGVILIASADEGRTVGPFSSATPDCSSADLGAAFCPTISAGQSTQYTFTWQPPEGQHNIVFTTDCEGNCSGGSSQSITTNVIQTSPTVDQVKTISGNLQRGTSGATLEPFVINALDTAGDPVEGVSIDWEILPTNGGTLLQLTTRTDANGQSSNTLTLETSDRLVVKATVNPNNTPGNSQEGGNNLSAVHLNGPASVAFVVNGGIAEQPGFSRNQRSVAKAMDSMCIALAELGEGRSAEQNDLWRTCQRLAADEQVWIYWPTKK